MPRDCHATASRLPRDNPTTTGPSGDPSAGLLQGARTAVSTGYTLTDTLTDGVSGSLSVCQCVSVLPAGTTVLVPGSRPVGSSLEGPVVVGLSRGRREAVARPSRGHREAVAQYKHRYLRD